MHKRCIDIRNNKISIIFNINGNELIAILVALGIALRAANAILKM